MWDWLPALLVSSLPWPRRRPPMTSQGTARGRFGRAIRDRHLARAEMAVREMGRLSLADALSLLLLIGEFEPERWPRAAARWHARFVLEARGIDLDEVELVLAAVRALCGPHSELAAQTLRQLAYAHGLDTVVAALDPAVLPVAE